MSKKLKKGMLCAYDRNNDLGFSITAPVQVELDKKISHKLFGHSIWRCKNLEENDSNIEYLYCCEKFLEPAGFVVIRNPANMPIINDYDIDVVTRSIEIQETLVEEFKKYKKDLDFSNYIKRLKMLKNKLETINKMQNL